MRSEPAPFAPEPLSARAEITPPATYGVVKRVTHPLTAAPRAGLRPRVSVASSAPPTTRVASRFWRPPKPVAWQTPHVAGALAYPPVLASRRFSASVAHIFSV